MATKKSPALKTNGETKKVVPARRSQIGLREEKQRDWILTVPVDIEESTLLDPAFYSVFAMELRPGDVITVIAEDISWEMTLRVKAPGRNWAIVGVSSERTDIRTGEKLVSLSADYQVEYAGLERQWRVLRRGDEVRNSFPSEAAARKWAATHEDAVTR